MHSPIDPKSAWQATLGRLQLEIPAEQFNQFLRPCVGDEWEGGSLVIAAASSYAVAWLTLPLHLAMAEEALTKAVGQDTRILYRAMPDVAGVPHDEQPTAPAATPEPEEPDQCPNHPEAFLRRRTKLQSLLREADRTGDEIFYCTGDSGHCTWVYSRQLGVFIRPGMAQQSRLDVLRAYEVARQEARGRDRMPAGAR